VSATDASRKFSEMLDQVEAGRSFLVERHGRDVCVITRPPVTGRRGEECLAILRGRTPVVLDDRFSKDLLDILAREGVEERPTWDS